MNLGRQMYKNPAATLVAYLTYSPLQNAAVSGNDVLYTGTFTDDGRGLGTLSVPSLGTAIYQAKVGAYVAGETRTAQVGFADNTNLFGPTNMLIVCWCEDSGKFTARRKSDGLQLSSSAGLISVGYYYRVRTDGVNMYADYSADGNTWTNFMSDTQPSGILRTQFHMASVADGARKLTEPKQYGLV